MIRAASSTESDATSVMTEAPFFERMSFTVAMAAGLLLRDF
jgi:hypothetical protein